MSCTWGWVSFTALDWQEVGELPAQNGNKAEEIDGGSRWCGVRQGMSGSDVKHGREEAMSCEFDVRRCGCGTLAWHLVDVGVN